MQEYIEKYYLKYAIYGEKMAKIMCLKDYLSDTDYAIIKMYEEVVQGGSIIEMLKEYKEVLSKRKEARQKINELEKEVANGN